MPNNIYTFYQRHPYPYHHSHLAGTRQWIVSILSKCFIDQPPLRILDAGCGTGVFSHTIANAFKSSRVVGADSSPTATEIARERAQEMSNIEILLHDFASGPLNDAQACDFFFCHGVLHHCSDPVKVLRNVLASCPGAKNGYVWLYSKWGRTDIEQIRWIAQRISRAAEIPVTQESISLIREIRSYFPCAADADNALVSGYIMEGDGLDFEKEDELLIRDRYLTPIAEHYSVDCASELFHKCGLKIVDCPTFEYTAKCNEGVSKFFHPSESRSLDFFALAERLLRPSGIAYIVEPL